MPLSSIQRLPANRRNEILQRLSVQTKRLRGGLQANSSLDVTKRGRQDSLRAMLTRAGIIPIHTLPGSVALHGYVQAYPGTRAAGEVVTVTGVSNFAAGDPALDFTFGASGSTTLAATSSFDTNATGQGVVVIP